MMNSQIKKIHLTDELPDQEVEKLLGKSLGHDSYDLVIKEDADVYTPQGEVLMKYRMGVIPAEMIRETHPIWREAAMPTDNRGMAAGEVTELSKIRQGKAVGTDGNRAIILKRDGTISKRTRSKIVLSGVVGYFNRDPQRPYCRMTAYTLKEGEKFAKCMPMIKLVDEVFRQAMPDRHAAQLAVHQSSSKDFRIEDTSFSTVTVNKNFITACHRDQGDLKKGFGVMTAIRSGKYTGGYTCWPKYRVAVDLQNQGVVMADVNRVHGNVPISGIPGLYERISLVFYFREGLKFCSTAEEELRRAREVTEKFYERSTKGGE